ncbi:MAG: sigma-54-dependent transcriptional regulator [Candidatus Methylacidiphilales bacterium]
MTTEPIPTLLIIDDENDVHYSFERLLKKDALKIFSAGHPAKGIELLRKHQPDVVVMDIRMGKENGLDTLRDIRAIHPRQIVIMMTAYGTSQTAIEAMKLGAYDYILKPFDIPELKALLHRALESARATRETAETLVLLEGDEGNSGMIGQSAPMQAVYKLVGQVAPTDATVLITGESGTGKELVARAVVAHSKRAKKTFITLNCAAIPENLLESELFGHEKGAFTGAMTQRIGKFEQCDGGTLFLDEIGEMPLPIQSKLLRMIQEGEFTRVGGNKALYSDVRLIAATNRNLLDACRAKQFREDLYYRLNVFSIRLPPLRERRSDIARMAAFFMQKWKKRHPGAPDKLGAETVRILSEYSWPGNVRELENTIQRALVLATGDTITPSDLPLEVRSSEVLSSSVEMTTQPVDGASSGVVSAARISPGLASEEEAIRLLFEAAEKDPSRPLLEWLQDEFIRAALVRTGSNQVRTAKLLGITRSTLRARMEKRGL